MTKDKMPNEIWAYGAKIGDEMSWAGHKGYLGRKDDVKYTRTDHMQAQLDEVIECFDAIIEQQKILKKDPYTDLLCIYAKMGLTKLKERLGK